MDDKEYTATIRLTFKESSFKSATRFNLRCKHIIEKALGKFVTVECISLKEKGITVNYDLGPVHPIPTLECGSNFDEDKLRAELEEAINEAWFK